MYLFRKEDDAGALPVSGSNKMNYEFDLNSPTKTVDELIEFLQRNKGNILVTRLEWPRKVSHKDTRSKMSIELEFPYIVV